MSLYEYLLKRFVYTVFTLVAVSLIIFGMTQALPGSAADIILGQYATEESVQALEQELGLDRPIHTQYIDWLGGVVTGAWGQSLTHRAPVLEVVIPRLIRSIELALFSLLLISIIGISLGVLAAVKRDTSVDTLISSISYVGVSIPAFVSGTILILFFAGTTFNVLPGSGYVPRAEGIIPWLQHLIMPSIALTIVGVAHVMRQTRSGLIEALRSEYVRTARLKGLSEKRVIGVHAVRNGLMATITILALSFGWLLGSIVVVEEVFSYPGLGRLVIESIQSRDLPVIQICILIIASAYTIGNLIADIIYTKLDPRISYE